MRASEDRKKVEKNATLKNMRTPRTASTTSFEEFLVWMRTLDAHTRARDDIKVRSSKIIQAIRSLLFPTIFVL
jgi:hypothetical protein